jgi:RNA polymerase sigma-70 factor, ECF subfamily
MRLSAERREVIDLVYYHKRSIDEVAKIIGISERAVKSRMQSARD